MQVNFTSLPSLTLAAQVMDIDLSKESPCGHGVVTCFSVYGGHHDGNVICNFAADTSGVVQDQLWVDTMLEGDKVRKRSIALYEKSPV